MKRDIIIALNAGVLCFLGLLSLAIIGVGMVVIFYENPPVVYNVNPAPTDKKTYKVGEYVKFLADRCKTSSPPFTLYKTWRGPVEFAETAERKGGSHVIGCKVSHFRVKIPPLPSGRYYLHEKIVYHVLPFINRTVNLTTEEFEVLQ